MEIIKLENTSKAERIFEGWKETLIYSCIQKIMGKIYVTNLDNPDSALAYVGCFGFVAGKPDIELLKNIPSKFAIITPQNDEWSKLIEIVYPNANKVTRYAIKKDTKFDITYLKKNLELLPDGYELKNIDEKILMSEEEIKQLQNKIKKLISQQKQE